jgi:hypothetical protein
MTVVVDSYFEHEKYLDLALLRSWVQLPPCPLLSLWLVTVLIRACLGLSDKKPIINVWINQIERKVLDEMVL